MLTYPAPDLTDAAPGDAPPRIIPVYEEWPGGTPVEGGVVTDLEEGWYVDRVELDAPTEVEPTTEQKLADLTDVVDTLLLASLEGF